MHLPALFFVGANGRWRRLERGPGQVDRFPGPAANVER